MAKTTNKYRKKYIMDYAFRGVVYLFSGLAVLPLFFIFGFIFSKGLGALNWEFFTSLPKPVGESGGGVLNAITGTLMVVGIGSVFALPVGIMAGTYLSEYRDSRLAKTLSLAIEVLHGVPSIVIGIVIYAWVVKTMGSFSAFSGGLALGIMMIPVVARNTEETLKMLPGSLREASLALGATQAVTLFRVVLPAGLAGVITGVLVSVARVAGETAPLLFTAFGNPFVNWNPAEPVHSLPLLIFNYAISPYDDWHRLAWGAAALLLISVLLLNMSARWLARKYSHDL